MANFSYLIGRTKPATADSPHRNQANLVFVLDYSMRPGLVLIRALDAGISSSPQSEPISPTPSQLEQVRPAQSVQSAQSQAAQPRPNQSQPDTTQSSAQLPTAQSQVCIIFEHALPNEQLVVIQFILMEWTAHKLANSQKAMKKQKAPEITETGSKWWSRSFLLVVSERMVPDGSTFHEIWRFETKCFFPKGS